jgi:AraC-binding-like domain
MRQSDKTFDSAQLGYEAWRDLFRSKSGRYYSEGIKPNAFTGWVRPVSVRGFTALDIGCNAHRVERTYRDVRLDGADHYFALFQVGGQLAMTHNDQAVRLAAGDVALVDAAQPVTYSADSQDAPWNTVSLNLPRQTLISHLGFEPEGGLYKRSGTERLLGVCSSTSFVIMAAVKDQSFRPLILTCNWRSMISSAPYLHHLTRGPFRGIQTSCSHVFGMLSKTVLLIQISVLTRWQPKRGYRYVTYRSSLPSAV